MVVVRLVVAVAVDVEIVVMAVDLRNEVGPFVCCGRCCVQVCVHCSCGRCGSVCVVVIRVQWSGGGLV